MLLSRGDPLADAVTALLLDGSSRTLRLALPPAAAAAVAAAGPAARWRVDLFANTVTHERCTAALERFANSAAGAVDAAAASASSAGGAAQRAALLRLLAGLLGPGAAAASALGLPRLAR